MLAPAVISRCNFNTAINKETAYDSDYKRSEP